MGVMFLYNFADSGSEGSEDIDDETATGATRKKKKYLRRGMLMPEPEPGHPDPGHPDPSVLAPAHCCPICSLNLACFWFQTLLAL